MTTTVAHSEASVLPERFAVEVAADDIMHGRPCNAKKCPIALAIARWLENQRISFSSVTVSSDDVVIHLGWRSSRWSYWHDATSLVAAFDHGDSVEPRTVVLARLP